MIDYLILYSKVQYTNIFVIAMDTSDENIDIQYVNLPQFHLHTRMKIPNSDDKHFGGLSISPHRFNGLQAKHNKYFSPCVAKSSICLQKTSFKPIMYI